MFLRLVKRSDISVASLIPNGLTTLALCCGLAAIHYSSKAADLHARGLSYEAVLPFWERALTAILLSAIFDALDGRAARLLRVTSKFGAVLDSLSDFLSFGVAPAMILHQWTLYEFINPSLPSDHGGVVQRANVFGITAVMTFAVCSALRLARFTAATPPPKPSHSAYFVGMPTPAAAGAVLIPALLDASKTLNWPTDWPKPHWLVVCYTLLISFLMISRVPMFSLKKLRISRPLVAPLLALVGAMVAMMMFDPWLTIAIISGAYLLSAPAAIVLSRRQRLKEQEHPSPDSTSVG